MSLNIFKQTIKLTKNQSAPFYKVCETEHM